MNTENTVEPGLRGILKAKLKEATRPLTCVDLYDMPDVRAMAPSANRISDYLGNMWKAGDATRSLAPKMGNDASRWAYSFKERTNSVHNPVQHEYNSFPRSTIVAESNNAVFNEMLLYLGMISGTLSVPENHRHLVASITSGNFNPNYIVSLRDKLNRVLEESGVED